MKYFMSSVSGIGSSLRENVLLYVTAILLLIFSVPFFMLGSSSRILSLTDQINGLSYSLDLQIGKNLESDDININMTIFLHGLDGGRHDHTSLLTNRQVSQADEIVKMIMQCQSTAGNAGLQFHDEFIINNFPLYNQAVHQRIFKY